MGTYRVLSSMDTTMSRTNQRVVVFELAEIELKELFLGFGATSFGGEGDLFVVDFNSPLTHRIIQLAQSEVNVEIDLEQFKSRFEVHEGRRKKDIIMIM